MRAVQLCASTRLGCTPVWKVSSHPYSCTDQVIQFVRVYTPYTLKVTPLSHHEPRREHGWAGARSSSLYLCMTGFFKTWSIIAHSSSTAQNYWTILSGAESHGECATFGVWVEAFGAELVFLLNKKDRSLPEEPERVILKQ